MKGVTSEVCSVLKVRGQVYRHFSDALSYPQCGIAFFELISQLAEDINFLASHSGSFWLRKSETCPSFDVQGLAKEYTRLFRGPVKALVYPYESMHLEGEVFGESTQDIIKRYAEAGLTISPDFKDLPDHICVELEFMYFLCSRQKASLDRDAVEESSKLLGFQQNFFERHLGRWAPQFCRNLDENTTEPYFKLISSLMCAFLNSEKNYFDLNPA